MPAPVHHDTFHAVLNEVLREPILGDRTKVTLEINSLCQAVGHGGGVDELNDDRVDVASEEGRG